MQSLVGRVAAVDADGAELVDLRAAFDDLRRLRSWVDGREVALARSIAALSSFPEKALAEAGRTSLRHAEVVFERAGTAEVVPTLAVSLEAGGVSGEHVDVLSRVLRRLEPAARGKLIEAAPGLVVVAEQSTADEFAPVVRAEAQRLERAGWVPE